jgi:AraC family transcriptional regulator
LNRALPVLESQGLAVLRFDHPVGEGHDDPDEETTAAFSVSLVERGSFALREDGRARVLEPGDVFLTRPGVRYAYRHAPEGAPDDICVATQFSPAFVEADPELHERLLASSPSPAGTRSNRVRYLALRLSRLLPASAEALEGAKPPKGPEALEREQTAVALLREAALADAPARRPVTQRQLRWYASRVDLVRDLLAARCHEPHSLGELARSAGMSPFHFARVFAELAGAPPHRYLLELRLKRGLERVRQGCPVTETALALGFSTPSHFTRAFRSRFGVPPSHFAGSREWPGGPRLPGDAQESAGARPAGTADSFP